MANGKRLLFFDLLRIVSVAFILIHHVAYNYQWRSFDAGIFTIFRLNFGVLGTYLLIFVSGAVLEYTYHNLSDWTDISEFYVKRLFRIYPAFWMSMLMGILVSPALLSRPAFNTFLEFTGFTTWAGLWGGLINPCGWFVGLIVALYFFYPFLSSSIKKYPYLMLFLIAFTEIALRCVFLNILVPGFAWGPDRWFPPCNFLEFGLGIWIVQQNIYPNRGYDNRIIIFLAEISFYVFLIHWIVGMPALMTASFPVYISVVGLLAWLMMLGDAEIQKQLKKVFRDNMS